MTKSANSLFYFGVYVLLIGLTLCLVPDKFIAILKLPEIPLSWARLIGFLAIIIGGYEIISGRNNIRPLIKASIYLRLFFFLGVMFLFLSGQMTKEILPIGIIDLIGAIWTALAMRAEI